MPNRTISFYDTENGWEGMRPKPYHPVRNAWARLKRRLTLGLSPTTTQPRSSNNES